MRISTLCLKGVLSVPSLSTIFIYPLENRWSKLWWNCSVSFHIDYICLKSPGKCFREQNFSYHLKCVLGHSLPFIWIWNLPGQRLLVFYSFTMTGWNTDLILFYLPCFGFIGVFESVAWLLHTIISLLHYFKKIFLIYFAHHFWFSEERSNNQAH